jgi:hypothetical protein
MTELQMIRFHIDCDTGVKETDLIAYLEKHCDSGMCAYEIATKTDKPHFQGWFMFDGTCTQFRDNIRKYKDFKNRVKGAGKFSFGQNWTHKYDNKLGLPRREYHKRYMTKGHCVWLKNIDPEQYKIWEQEFKSIDQTKQKTLVKDKNKKLNINQSLIAFVDAKLETCFSKKLDIDKLFDLMIDWFGQSSKDLDDFIIIRKLNMLHLHFEKKQWVDLNKKRLIEKYKNIHNF